MREFHSVAAVRASEAPLLAALPDGVLMRRAAHGLARVVAAELKGRVGGVAGRAVGLLVGSGDNGGDALWAGAMLRGRGVAVTAVLLDPARAHHAGLTALLAAGGRIVDRLPAVDLVLDGIVGISGRGPLRPAAAELVSQVRAPIIAVDLPSGVDPDTGTTSGPAVRAAVTVAFGALKPVHALAADRCGRVELIDIGLALPAPELTALGAADAGALWPVPGPDDDKYSQGVTGIIAGSHTYPGAAILCAGAAVAATSGMVRYVGTGRTEVLTAWPEIVATERLADAARVQAWVVGPGMGVDAAAGELLRTVLATDLPVLVDADGLTLLAANPQWARARRAPTLLTPHAGEFARLARPHPEVPSPVADRVGAARALAADLGVSVLLKGRATVIADPDGQVRVNEAGGSWESTAGSGDILAGLIGALLAAGLDPLRAAAAGARVHSRAAELAALGGTAVGAPISASAMLAQVRPAVRAVRAAASAQWQNW
ncbi:NAD(P)H-hydrate dehydratase [Tomitella biformata]|uniref:NAD(P)H-hydrate dehydratase n=1 Tax=Tomitella biformata TaxID=630403 RepID=UPI00046306CA|nr:NAD(P)H-hydrate dehydratase [Tomitella biformata]